MVYSTCSLPFPWLQCSAHLWGLLSPLALPLSFLRSLLLALPTVLFFSSLSLSFFRSASNDCPYYSSLFLILGLNPCSFLLNCDVCPSSLSSLIRPALLALCLSISKFCPPCFALPLSFLRWNLFLLFFPSPGSFLLAPHLHIQLDLAAMFLYFSFLKSLMLCCSFCPLLRLRFPFLCSVLLHRHLLPLFSRFIYVVCPPSLPLSPPVFKWGERLEKWKWTSLSRVWLFATPRLYSPWNSPGQNTGVGSLPHLQGIVLTQDSNHGLLHYRRILYQMSY